MSLKDSLDGLFSRVKDVFSRGNDGPQDGDTPIATLENGGFSGYRPSRQKSGDLFSTQSMRPQKEQTARQGATGTYGSPAVNETARQPMQGGDPLQQYTGAFGGFQTQWQQPMQPQPTQPPVMDQPAAQPGWGAQQPVMNQPQQPAMNPPADNIVPFPSLFVGDDGRTYAHVERVAQVLSPSACFRVMEFMRNGESVIINSESIGNEAEVQRCLDMISGAAFTLGCSMTRLTQGNRAWLVAPGSVLVMQDAAVSHWGDRGGARPEQMEQSRASYGSTYQPQQPEYQQTAYQQPEYQQTAYRQPEYQQTAYRQPEYQQTAWQPAAQQTVWQQPAAGEAYESDTRKGVYAMPGGSMNAY